MNPLVTIGVSCHNAARHLPSLLDSVYAQTYSNWELLIVDDGSTDDTPRLLSAVQHPAVTVIADGRNLGLGTRLNQIHGMARGALIARTDADDLLHPQRLARQVEFLLQHPEVDVCATGAYCLDDEGNLRGERRIPPLARNRRDVMLRNGPSHPTIMAWKEWFLRFPYCTNPKRGQDLDLWIRSIESSRIAVIAEPLHFIRENARFDLAKYRRSLRDHRKIFRRHAPFTRNPALSLEIHARSYAKEIAYTLADGAGLLARVAQRRLSPLPEATLQEAAAILGGLQKVCLP